MHRVPGNSQVPEDKQPCYLEWDRRMLCVEYTRRAPGWLSRFSDRRLISAQVVISVQGRGTEPSASRPRSAGSLLEILALCPSQLGLSLSNL